MLFAGTVSTLGLLQKLWWRMSLSERLTRFFYKTHSFTQIMSSTLVTCLPIPQIMRVPIQWSSFQQERNSIVIKWESETTNILGFRVIYRCPLFWTRKHRWSRVVKIRCIALWLISFWSRLFGTPQFKQGPPLAPSEREFKIKNVPDNECIVVCVVSLEEVEPSHHLEL